MESRSKVFIGSSVEGLNIAYAIQQNLAHWAEVTVWDQGVFELSKTTIESLMDTLEKSDFGIFVFSPDDIIKIKGKQHPTVRDNVIFELGLFVGKLGRNRAFVVIPEKSTFHIPTDLLGVTTGKYETNRSDNSMQAATGAVCNTIRESILKLGSLKNNIDNEASRAITEAVKTEPEQTSEYDWFDYYLTQDYKKSLEALVGKEFQENDVNGIYENKYWQTRCKIKIGEEYITNIVKEFIVNDESIKAYRDGIRFLLEEDHTYTALELIEEGILKYNHDETLLLVKIDCLLKDDKAVEAIDILLKDLKKTPDSVLKLTNIYKDTKQIDKALAVINEGYKLFPNSESILFMYAELAHDGNQFKESLFLYDKLVSKFSSNNVYWGYLANTCLQLNLYDKAMLAYRKGEELSEGKADWILANIGNLLINKGFYAEGKIHLQRALLINTESDYTFNRMNFLLEYQKKENDTYNDLVKEGKTLIRNSNNTKDEKVTEYKDL